MTSRTKRRLTVLALALGLIAAAPYAFHALVDRHPVIALGTYWSLVARTTERSWRVVDVRAGRFSTQYVSDGKNSVLALEAPTRDWHFHFPDEFITLRVACAVGLAGVWVLVVVGQWLARRWTRANRDAVAA